MKIALTRILCLTFLGLMNVRITHQQQAAGIGKDINELIAKKKVLFRHDEIALQKNKEINKWIRLQSVRDATSLLYVKEKEGELKPGHCAMPDLHGENDFRTAYVFTRMLDNSGSHTYQTSIDKDWPMNVPVYGGKRGQGKYQEQIFFNYQRSAAYERVGMLNFGYILAFEGNDPPETVLSQEGNSFCIVGSHYYNSPDLKNNPRFIEMSKLGTFDIGSHTYPLDYLRMNVHDPEASDTDTDEPDTVERWKYICNNHTDLSDASLEPSWNIIHNNLVNIPAEGYLVWYSPNDSPNPNPYKVEFDWETRYPNSNNPNEKGNGSCPFTGFGTSGPGTSGPGIVEKEFWPQAWNPNPRYPYILDYIDYPPHPAAKIRQMLTPYPDSNNKSQFGFMYRPAYHTDQPDSRCRNPYFLQVSEIEVNGVRLHNWLHITVYVRREYINQDPNRKNCPTGKMKYIILEVRDQNGLPVGDFSNDMPCEKSGTCGCKSSKCRAIHGNKYNAMPCMFTPERAVSQPGIFMYGSKSDDYFDEVHVSWKFAQHTSSFTSQLHFASLILESDKKLRYYNGRQTFYENPLKCKDSINPCRTYPYDPQGPRSDCSCEFSNKCKDWFQGDNPCSPHATDPDKDKKKKRNSRLGWHWNENYQFQTFEKTGNEPLGGQSNHRAVVDEKHCRGSPGTVSDDIRANGIHYFYDKDYRQDSKQGGYYSFSLQHIVSSKRKIRPYGWNAQYRVLSPTYKTLGAPDPFKLTPFVDLTSINCHKRVNTEFYKSRSKPNGKLPVRQHFYEFKRAYKLDEPKKTCGRDKFSTWECPEIVDKETALRFATNDNSDFETTYTQIPLTQDIKNPRGDYAGTIQMSTVYFGTLGTKEAYIAGNDLTSNGEMPLPKEVNDYISSLPKMKDIAYEERCACPAYGTTLAPENVTKDVSELQGRGHHASQMLFAWIFLIPVGVFVMRYYKETYSKVFIFREFWWYTVHFGCLWTALLFMIGGILAIEYKREEAFLINFSRMSDAARVHLILGSISMILFFIELLHNFFRPKRFEIRSWHIAIHFILGSSLYIIGGIAVMFSAWIPQSRMSCGAFETFICFVVFQIIMYIIMEVHQRHVDRLLALYPPRSHFPVMVVRVFHTNAPLPHFRMFMLIIFVVVSLCVYFIMRFGQIEYNVRACFKNQGLDYEEDAYF